MTTVTGASADKYVSASPEAPPGPQADERGTGNQGDPFLLISNDGKSCKVVNLRGHQVVTVGRRADNTLVLDDPCCSRRHCVLLESEGQWFLRNLSISNGTRVDGTKVDGCQLRDGDVIRVGKTHIMFTVVVPTASFSAPREAGAG